MNTENCEETLYEEPCDYVDGICTRCQCSEPVEKEPQTEKKQTRRAAPRCFQHPYEIDTDCPRCRAWEQSQQEIRDRLDNPSRPTTPITAIHCDECHGKTTHEPNCAFA